MKRTPLARKTPLRRKRPADKSVPVKARKLGLVKVRTKGRTPKRSMTRQIKPMTPEEREHSTAVRRMRCWACEIDQDPCPPPTNNHHIKECYGNRKASHWEQIPLCEGHHQGQFDITRLAYHKAPKTFCLRYGNQVAILRVILARVGLTLDDIPRLRGSLPPWWSRYKRGCYDNPPQGLPDGIRDVLTQPQERP